MSNMEEYVNQHEMGEASTHPHQNYSPTFVEFLNEKGLHYKFDEFIDNHKDEFLQCLIEHGTRLPYSYDHDKLKTIFHDKPPTPIYDQPWGRVSNPNEPIYDNPWAHFASNSTTIHTLGENMRDRNVSQPQASNPPVRLPYDMLPSNVPVSRVPSNVTITAIPPPPNNQQEPPIIVPQPLPALNIPPRSIITHINLPCINNLTMYH